MISNEALWREFLENRDRNLRERLTLQYAPLVKYVINSMSMTMPSQVTLDDIIGYGTIGLLHAVDRYDPDRGVTFETYAIPRVRGAIIDAIRSMSILSRSDTTKLRAIEHAMDQLVQEKLRSPTEQEIADLLGITAKDVERTLVASNVTFVSIDAPIEAADGGETSSLKNMLVDPGAVDPGDAVEQSELRDLLRETIRQLQEPTRLVLSLYYVDELSPMEIAEVLGVSRSRVYQIHAHAILELRARMRAHLAKSTALVG